MMKKEEADDEGKHQFRPASITRETWLSGVGEEGSPLARVQALFIELGLKKPETGHSQVCGLLVSSLLFDYQQLLSEEEIRAIVLFALNHSIAYINRYRREGRVTREYLVDAFHAHQENEQARQGEADAVPLPPKSR